MVLSTTLHTRAAMASSTSIPFAPVAPVARRLRPREAALRKREPCLMAAREGSAVVLRQRRLAVLATASAAAAPAAPSGGSGTAPSSSGLGALANALTNAFPLWVLGCALWALRQPAAFTWLTPAAVTPALAVTMLGMGLTLTFEDFRRVLTHPSRIFAGFALQYTIMPLCALAVSRLACLPLDYCVGLCIVGSCPGGTASNVVTYLAKADVTLSVAMTTASTLGAVLATPLLTQLLLGTLVPVDAAGLLVSTLQVVLLPVVVGAAINTAFPKQVARLGSLFSLTAVALIALICGSVVGAHRQAVLEAGPRLLGAIVALHAGGFFFGYALSRLLGLPEKAARTNSIEVGMQNSALGAVLAQAHFAANPLAAVPCAISACTHSVMGSMLAAWWRGQPTGEEAEPSATSVTSGEWVEEAGVLHKLAPAAAAAAAPAQLQQAQAVAGQQLAAAKAAVDTAAESAARKAEAAAWIAAWRQRTAAGAGAGAANPPPADAGAAPCPAPAESQARISQALHEADLAARKSEVRRIIDAHRRRTAQMSAGGSSSGGGVLEAPSAEAIVVGGVVASAPSCDSIDGALQRLSVDEIELLLSSDSF